MSYDTKCWELACYFLVEDYTPPLISATVKSVNTADAAELAQRIQDTIEDFIAEKLRTEP